MLDPIQNQGLRLCLGAFRTSPADSLCVEANELPLRLRREKLALQFATKIAANPNNPVYDTIFNPRYVELFRRKPRVISTFGIRIKESLEELDFNPDIIAKFEFPETPPWTYPTAMVNLTLSYAKKDQTDPSQYISLHNEVKDVFRDYDFIYTDGSVADDKAAAAAVIDNYSSIERLPDKSSIFSAELHALYLALDRVETADDDERNFIIFSDSKSALQAISGQDWTHPLVLYILERLNWLVHYQEKRILFYWIPSHVGIRGNEKADTAAKAGLSRRVTDVSIPYGDFKKHINSLLKRKWQAQWDETANNKLHEIHPQLGLWPGGSRIIRREESVLARIRIGHTHLTHCFLLKGEDPPQCIACDCQLTVKHILFECVDFIESRNRHFNVDTFRELFEKVPPDSILSYLHEIGLFYRL